MAACQDVVCDSDSEQERKMKVNVSLKRDRRSSNSRNDRYYPPCEVPALRNINLKISTGKPRRWWGVPDRVNNHASLIYDIDEGHILMDGHDLREYTWPLYVIRWRWFRKTCICF
ncbi:hypothetical protein KCP74_21590 [Salmonella enterica subsp. enterica]|nr:hypothetical protein KCP74_21590 [Salmonella enterica subsp. enterica]